MAPHPAMLNGKWPGIAHVFYDANAPEAERYKLVWCTPSAVYLTTSSDGINFINRTRAFTHRVEATPSLFYDTIAGEWAMYGRKRGDWPTHDPVRRGIVRHSTTREFETPWTSVGVVAVDPLDVFKYVPTQTGHPNPDDRSTQDVGPDFYQAGVQVYHGQYVGLPATFFINPQRLALHRPDRWTGPIYPLFMHSHDGLRWHFPDLEHSMIDMGPICASIRIRNGRTSGTSTLTSWRRGSSYRPRTLSSRTTNC